MSNSIRIVNTTAAQKSVRGVSSGLVRARGPFRVFAAWMLGTSALLAHLGAMGQVPGERGDHTANGQSNTIVVAGGNDNFGSRAPQTLRFDPAANEWGTAGALITPRFLHTATTLTSGRLLVTGGTNGSILGEAEIYDPLTFTWSAAAPMNVARYGHTATLLDDGRVLVTGGRTASGVTATCELYDPATGKWTIAPSMRTARSEHIAVKPWSGGSQVLVAGGANEAGALASTEIYEAASNSWSPAADMAQARSAHAAVSLPTGMALVSGGNAGKVLLDSAERFSFASRTWIPAGVLPSPRKLHTMTLLTRKEFYLGQYMGSNVPIQVLATGGYDGVGALASGGLYSLGSNSWSQVADLITPRWGHTATQAVFGVLVIGGFNPKDGYLASAEMHYLTRSVNWGNFPVNAAELSAPVGTSNVLTPKFQWWAVPGAVSYALWVGDQPDGTSRYYASYTSAEAGCAGGSGACEVSPPLALVYGQSYRWGINAVGGTGAGVWSAPGFFYLQDPSGLPAAPQGLWGPRGATNWQNPTFRWNRVANASSYRLRVREGGVDVFNRAVTSSEAGCLTAASCNIVLSSLTPLPPLTATHTYTWDIQAVNDVGVGPWSDGVTIWVAPPKPSAPTLAGPMGAVSGVTPTYSWNAEPGEWRYDLYMSLTLIGNTPPTNLIHIEYSAAEAGCAGGAGLCSVTPATKLQPGTSYSWVVRRRLLLPANETPPGGVIASEWSGWSKTAVFVVAN